VTLYSYNNNGDTTVSISTCLRIKAQAKSPRVDDTRVQLPISPKGVKMESRECFYTDCPYHNDYNRENMFLSEGPIAYCDGSLCSLIAELDEYRRLKRCCHGNIVAGNAETKTITIKLTSSFWNEHKIVMGKNIQLMGLEEVYTH